MKKKRVSLYIPCYNATEYIARCIEAVKKQTYPVDEILIIDDASSDDSAAIAASYGVKVISHDTNKGLAAARNTALKNATGDVIASLDADCVPHKDWLKNLMQYLDGDAVAGVGGKLIESSGAGIKDTWRAIHMAQAWGDTLSENIPFLFGSNTLFRRDVLLEIGGYDERHRCNYEDVDISQKVQKKGYSLVYTPDAIAQHLKRDTLDSLFMTFWNWNFVYHEQKGFYTNEENFYKKIKENIGIANRFMVDDLYHERNSLLYLDFLLGIYLSLNDFLFMLKSTEEGVTKELPLYLPKLVLLDLSLFYRLDAQKDSLRTLIDSHNRFLQSIFAFILIAGGIFDERFRNDLFTKTAFRHLYASILYPAHHRADEPVAIAWSLFRGQRDWSDLLHKEHGTIDKKFLQYFFSQLDAWLRSIHFQFPEIFNLVKVSQYDLQGEEVT